MLLLAVLPFVCGCVTATTATTRAELKAVSKPGEASPGLEGSILLECRWGGPTKP